MEDLGSQILRLFAVSDAVDNERVDTFEVVLVEFGKAKRVALRRLDQQPLVGFVLKSPHSDLPGESFLNDVIPENG